ncbi:MAG: ATP synthase F0 subunit C [Oscillospiraceae bacterium]|nr:ATP synthase F0 subunit C [Oscillospiraceae bacterium]MCD8344239.1 ATP synthase F0 subunit C [Oscillospiraceae bacterium]MCD8374283.1 ATP synthase F0 subunit C [Oscillospiraceae bacterium]
MKTRKFRRIVTVMLLAILAVSLFAVPVLAAGEQQPIPTGAPETVNAETEESDNSTGLLAIAAGLAISFPAMGGAIGMGIATGKSAEGIARQPEAEGKIRTTMMLGLVFIETCVIYALIITILIIFVM